jgi:hypothetical protein
MSQATNHRLSSGFLTILGLIWLALVVTGFGLLAHEEFTPVKAVASATLFPEGSAIQLAPDKPTLVLFAHPECPCTKASFHELNHLLVTTHDKVSLVIVFTIPDGMPTGWEQGELWNTATTFPDVRVVRDQGGREAKLFKVTGSGHTLLYTPSGELLFSGGITGSRGHEGDNAGLSAVESFILTGRALVDRTPVFGCSLL